MSPSPRLHCAVCLAQGQLPQEVNFTGPPGAWQAQHRGLRWGGGGDWEIAQGRWRRGHRARGGQGAHRGGEGHWREVGGRALGHRGGRRHERQEEAAVIGIGLQDRGESKDGAVRGIFNTEQGVLSAVTCTKEKEQSGSSTHGGKGHKKGLEMNQNSKIVLGGGGPLQGSWGRRHLAGTARSLKSLPETCHRPSHLVPANSLWHP